jgi:hypothetical protein
MLAVLTDEGFRALEQAAPGHVAAVRQHVFDQLTAEEVDALGRISTKILDHLRQFVPDRPENAGDDEGSGLGCPPRC